MRGGASTRTVCVANRKYLGSKRLLAPAFLELMLRESGLPSVFFDAFAGTGVVGAEALARGVSRVVAVDNLLSNTVVLRGLAYASRERGRLEALYGRIEELNSLDGREGYITESYAGTYFLPDNCRRMDAARERIEEWLLRGEIGAEEHDYLLAGFLLGADRVANTVGQYDAYLKHIGSSPVREGRHLVDGRVYSPFVVLPLEGFDCGTFDVLTGDVLSLAPTIDADVAYLDPPYNTRQYCDCYHVLENMARWERPLLAGKTRKPPREALKSPFSSRRLARGAFEALLGGVRAPDVYLSYSSEGLLSREELEELLGSRGSLKTHCFAHPVFGSGAGVARKREVTEYLFHLDRGGRVA